MCNNRPALTMLHTHKIYLYIWITVINTWLTVDLSVLRQFFFVPPIPTTPKKTHQTNITHQNTSNLFNFRVVYKYRAASRGGWGGESKKIIIKYYEHF